MLQAGSHELSILYTASIVHVGQSQPLSSPLQLSIRLFSMSKSPFVLYKQVHLHRFSRFPIYMLIYGICFSLAN